MTNQDMSDNETNQRMRLLTEQGSKRVSMLAFHRGDHIEPEGVNNNGTVSFIKFPAGKLLVTNHHVWDTFQNNKNFDSTYRLMLTGHGFAPTIDISEAEIVSESAEFDLCVLHYPPEKIEEIGKEFVDPKIWPPQRPKEDGEVLIIGYPGKRRSVELIPHPEHGRPIKLLRHEAISLIPSVVSISDRRAMLRFNNPNPEVTSFTDRKMTFQWGGMSGSLVYCGDKDNTRLIPCGIMVASGEGLEASIYSIHLDLINGDGDIVGNQR